MATFVLIHGGGDVGWSWHSFVLCTEEDPVVSA